MNNTRNINSEIKRMRCAIVVPIHKKKINIYEKVSLIQLRKILRQYDIYFIAPKGLEFDYGDLSDDISVIYFNWSYFQSKNSYSELMLSINFYQYFEEYDYILLYQLDAFVFSDRLEEFCSFNYDYIGAPMPYCAGDWHDIKASVGNGGFSLRKVDSFIRVLTYKNEIYNKMPKQWQENKFRKWEDLFFAFCANIPALNFRVPSFPLALDFAVGNDVAHAYDRMPKWLPFGCHAWYAIDFWHWKPVIESQGYELPDKRDISMRSVRIYRIYKYMIYRLLKYNMKEKCKKITNEIYELNYQNVAIWGAGKYGKSFIDFLNISKKNIEIIFDKHEGELYRMKFVLPTQKLVQTCNCPIIVTSIQYELEIQEELKKYGLKPGIDFFLLSDFMRQMIVMYVKYL